MIRDLRKDGQAGQLVSGEEPFGDTAPAPEVATYKAVFAAVVAEVMDYFSDEYLDQPGISESQARFLAASVLVRLRASEPETK